jgi:hypothetical protein
MPTDWFASASAFLEAHGLIPVIPHVRSSDFESCLGDPFRWYLRRRLGLIPMLYKSVALTRGKWFHTRAAIPSDDPTVVRATMDKVWGERVEELKTYFEALGIQGSSQASFLNEEHRDMMMALIWWEVANHTPLPSGDPALRGKTLHEILNQPAWHTLGREVKVTVPWTSRDYGLLYKTIEIDRLVYDEQKNGLWIIDYKTCDESPIVRLATCPVEFQTRHYIHTAKDALEQDLLDPLLGDFKPTRILGMIHPAVRKPTIIFGQNDRDCTITTRALTRGPRKGQMVEEKNYEGEPKYENYLARCNRWYRAEGEYEDKAGEWATDPPVNISWSHGNVMLDDSTTSLYNTQLTTVAQAITKPPHPGAFAQSASNMRLYGSLSKYAPFYLVPPGHWPEVINNEGFVVAHRD